MNLLPIPKNELEAGLIEFVEIASWIAVPWIAVGQTLKALVDNQKFEQPLTFVTDKIFHKTPNAVEHLEGNFENVVIKDDLITMTLTKINDFGGKYKNPKIDIKVYIRDVKTIECLQYPDMAAVGIDGFIQLPNIPKRWFEIESTVLPEATEDIKTAVSSDSSISTHLFKKEPKYGVKHLT